MHPARLLIPGGLLIALAMGRPLGAQDRAVVEIGVSAVRFPADSLTAVGPAARLAASSARGTLRVDGALGAVVGAGGASGYAEAGASHLRVLAPRWSVEANGEIGGLFATDAHTSTGAASVLAGGRLVRRAGAGGVWLRGTGSVSKRAPDLSTGTGVGAGAWWSGRTTRYAASLAREWNGAALYDGPRRSGYRGMVPVAYTELSLGVDVERSDASWSASGTLRRDPGAEHVVEPGGRVSAAYWVTPSRALLVSVASELPDFVHGADAARSLMLGMRFRGRSLALERSGTMRPIILVDGDSAARIVTVRAAGARTVEVMGDFSGWEPVSLARDGDVFRATLPMAPGSRRLVVRVDGGEWRPPANTPAVDDDFGGRVGLLLVP